MTLDLNFKQVCDLLKKDGAKDPKLIEATDNLLGLAMICSPLLVGPVALALLPLLGVKNELIKIGKYVFDKLSNKDNDYLARQERMQIAYGVLPFTAFFEALDAQIPDNLRARIRLLQGEKVFLAKAVAESLPATAKKTSDALEPKDRLNPITALALSFPHPTESLPRQIEHHANLWRQMADGFQQFLQKLAFWEEAKEEERTQIRSAIAKVPEEAAKHFEAQYCELARKYNEFAIWANLQEHKNTKALLGEVSGYLRQYAALAKAGQASIDIGFAKLHDTVLSIPEILKISQAAELVEALMRHYKARVEDPIIEEKDEPQQDLIRLSFPRICDAFIPQSYRALRYAGNVKNLEDDATWEGLTRRGDLGAFMLSYLSSPYSTETPLLILGHPGSGKSLLTKILSAQLMSKHFATIRVPLREVNAEGGVVAQIEEPFETSPV